MVGTAQGRLCPPYEAKLNRFQSFRKFNAGLNASVSAARALNTIS